MQEDREYQFIQNMIPQPEKEEEQQVMPERYEENLFDDGERPLKGRKRRLTGEAYVAVVQIVICAIVVLGLLLFRMVGGQYYQNFYQGFLELMNQKIELKDFPPKAVESQPEEATSSAAQSIVTGRISSPLQTGIISSRFGERQDPYSGELSEHQGIDIAAGEGEPVYSLLSGVVEQCGEDEIYGNYILLNHGCNIHTFYAHCREIKKVSGEPVKLGEEIAAVGNSGMATGYHLHLEVRINGNRVNPQYYLLPGKYDTI